MGTTGTEDPAAFASATGGGADVVPAAPSVPLTCWGVRARFCLDVAAALKHRVAAARRETARRTWNDNMVVSVCQPEKICTFYDYVYVIQDSLRLSLNFEYDMPPGETSQIAGLASLVVTSRDYPTEYHSTYFKRETMLRMFNAYWYW